MSRNFFASSAVALALGLASTALAADGAAVYRARCGMCHGKAGGGSSMVKVSIAGAAPEAVRKAVTQGVGKMKPVKLEAADLDAVTAYVHGLAR